MPITSISLYSQCRILDKSTNYLKNACMSTIGRHVNLGGAIQFIIKYYINTRAALEEIKATV